MVRLVIFGIYSSYKIHCFDLLFKVNLFSKKKKIQNGHLNEFHEAHNIHVCYVMYASFAATKILYEMKSETVDQDMFCTLFLVTLILC